MSSDAFVEVARLSEIPPGEVKCVEVNGTPIALCNVDGQFYAVGNVCTHDGGTLSGGTVEDHTIECPRHGARFDVRSGKVVCLPAPTPIPTYEVRVDGDVVKIKC